MRLPAMATREDGPAGTPQAPAYSIIGPGDMRPCVPPPGEPTDSVRLPPERTSRGPPSGNHRFTRGYGHSSVERELTDTVPSAFSRGARLVGSPTRFARPGPDHLPFPPSGPSESCPTIGGEITLNCSSGLIKGMNECVQGPATDDRLSRAVGGCPVGRRSTGRLDRASRPSSSNSLAPRRPAW